MLQLAAQLFHGHVCVIPSLSHLQGADKGSRVNFKCAICIWNLLLSTLNMRSKELSPSVKQAIIRLKKQNKPIREIAKTLGVAKSKNTCTFFYLQKAVHLLFFVERWTYPLTT